MVRDTCFSFVWHDIVLSLVSFNTVFPNVVAEEICGDKNALEKLGRLNIFWLNTYTYTFSWLYKHYSRASLQESYQIMSINVSYMLVQVVCM